MLIKLETSLALPEKIMSGGHQCLPTEKGRGLCASFFSPDELDKQAVEYVKSLNPNTSRAIDIGCSQYFPQAIRLAQLGLLVDAFDIISPIPEYPKINQELGGKIQYIKADLTEDISPHLSNKQYDLVYSNRFISHLPYLKAQSLFDRLFEHANKGCHFFISFGHISSDEAKIYSAYNEPLEKRFGIQSTELAKKHSLTNPVCLYHREEIYETFLGGYQVKVIDEIKGDASIKLVFKKV